MLSKNERVEADHSALQIFSLIEKLRTEKLEFMVFIDAYCSTVQLFGLSVARQPVSSINLSRPAKKHRISVNLT